MRWVKALIAASLVAVACAPAVPAEVSPSPTAAPLVRATPRTARTERPAPTATPVRTARPSPTPTVAGTLRPAPVQTARPAPVQPVVNAPCSEWPSEREVFDAMTHLPLPPSLCLLRATPELVGQTVCTVVGCIPVTPQCASAGSCIEVVESEHPHYVLVWFAPLPGLPPTFAEGYTLTRHLCRLHQEKTRLDAALRGRGTPTWSTTLEAAEFAAAFQFFRQGYLLEAQRWGVRPTIAENYVDVCSAWYYPYVRDQKVDLIQPLYLFAQKWLPRP